MQPLYSFKPDTYYIFNHIDFTVSYHGGKLESWGVELGDNIGRILSNFVTPLNVNVLTDANN